MIRVLPIEEIPAATEVIRRSFRSVAEQFSLTPENCRTHPSFLTEDHLRAQVADGLQLIGFDAGETLAGVIGVKQINDHDFSIEKLAVLPEYRHRRFGVQLMVYAQEQIVREGGTKACIGIIDEHTVLKEWYQQQGFAVTEIKRFPHLPFTVCMMEKVLNRP